MAGPPVEDEEWNEGYPTTGWPPFFISHFYKICLHPFAPKTWTKPTGMGTIGAGFDKRYGRYPSAEDRRGRWA